MALAIRLPLESGGVEAFASIKSLKALVKQNFKMLLLTIPGERVMEPEYGVGLNRYLFSNFHENVYSEIYQKITSQTQIYMPAISIDDIRIDSNQMDNSMLSISVAYSISSIGERDLLQVTI